MNADLKSGNLKRVYLLYGDDAFLKRSFKLRFLAAAEGGASGMNVSLFEGKNCSEDAVIDAADTMPFFADRRIVMVENSGWLKNSADRIADYIPKIPETAVLVFCEDEVNKRGRVFKAVQKCGYASELNHPDQQRMTDWAAAYLSRAGKKLTRSTMDHFLDYAGEDMDNVRNELDKLIAYLGDRDVVTAADVDCVTSRTPEGRIFDMVDAITSRRTREAMALYEDLLAERESPMRILYLIGRQYRQLLAAKELAAAGVKPPEIAKQLKIPSFAAGKLISRARQLSSPRLKDSIKTCAELEYAVKSGSLPERAAAELLICRES